jgi:hypothetical protein
MGARLLFGAVIALALLWWFGWDPHRHLAIVATKKSRRLNGAQFLPVGKIVLLGQPLST